ncbi:MULTISPECIES: patatin family protein [unclassified Clostridium]|uniref:patatin-like phospholipase family protein n=1 Tax=Clostridium TaxID=1485 RepID=UPI001C8B139B|nr:MULTISPECIES: patatin family protein [unclassified Clostridium]MBX9137523.1 patatin family protein [Clostridium sp. K12(2020)]MBX9144333.1 patatin family protein [Clostridium sp. K13]MDU4326476.1 patatin family protein [Clostridium celatum]
MPSLILEGGTLRPIFTAGILDALLDNNISFPYCIGVSAGITNGVSYLSKQKGRNLEILMKYRNDKRYLGYGNFLKCKSLFGLDFVFDEIPNKLVPFDMDTYKKYPGKVLVGVTNAKTGETEYLDGKELDDKATLLRATCAIPIFFPVIKINNNEYYDGGLCDPIPVRKAIEDGNKKHLIILTQPTGYRKELSKKNVFVSKMLSNKYPNLKDAFLTRHENYNATVKFCEELEKQGKAIILRPDYKLESFEKDTNKLQSNYQHGYEMAIKHLDKIKSLFK